MMRFVLMDSSGSLAIMPALVSKCGGSQSMVCLIFDWALISLIMVESISPLEGITKALSALYWPAASVQFLCPLLGFSVVDFIV